MNVQADLLRSARNGRTSSEERLPGGSVLIQSGTQLFSIGSALVVFLGVLARPLCPVMVDGRVGRWSGVSVLILGLIL